MTQDTSPSDLTDAPCRRLPELIVRVPLDGSPAAQVQAATFEDQEQLLQHLGARPEVQQALTLLGLKAAA